MINSEITKAIFSAGVCAAALMTASAQADPMPPEKSLSGLSANLVGRNDIYTYKHLDRYHEAPFLDDLVAAGKLPPVDQRLPNEPLVFKTAAMPDGIGVYGGEFRHVIGGRPEGWNWLAGQHQGWGGINMAVQECLVRQGPRWKVKAEDQTGPLPNLAKSWEWNDDKTELTMHLIEGAKWSDGVPFTTEDIAFWYNDNVQDPNVQSRMPANSFGGGAKLEVVDDSTFKFVFSKPQSNTLVESLAYIQGCPGPAHVLEAFHPKYNPDKTYDDYLNALPPDHVPVVTLGPWVPVEYKPDEIVIMRRNPYYWKVDEDGNQLPYMNEMVFKLTTWDDRTTQAVAGTGDFSNMENPGNYVEALKQSQDPNSPVRANFGPRTQVWRVELNYSADNVDDPVEKALRNLFREKDFRLALSHALDRDALGQALARGPFAYPYVAGLSTGSPYYDATSSDFQSYDQKEANSLLDGLGLADTDGDGVRNLPNGGEDITIDMSYRGNRNDDRKQVEAVTSQLADVGIRILPKAIDEANFDSFRNAGNFTALMNRTNWTIPTRETCIQLPISDNCPAFHLAGSTGRNPLPFEGKLADLYNQLVGSDDAAKQADLAHQIQHILTTNVYTVGTVQTPAALLVNKRIRNADPGTPVFMYEWAEDGVIRERLWVPKDQQTKEILPGTIPEYK